jgi:hypothetical protein
MKPNEITAQIVAATSRIHSQFGPGLLDKRWNRKDAGNRVATGVFAPFPRLCVPAFVRGMLG